MKKIVKITSISVLSLFLVVGCRNTKPNSEIGISCQRLSTCYSLYSNLLKDAQVKSLVESSQKSGDENQCVNAISQLSASVKQDCPF